MLPAGAVILVALVSQLLFPFLVAILSVIHPTPLMVIFIEPTSPLPTVPPILCPSIFAKPMGPNLPLVLE